MKQTLIREYFEKNNGILNILPTFVPVDSARRDTASASIPTTTSLWAPTAAPSRSGGSPRSSAP